MSKSDTAIIGTGIVAYSHLKSIKKLNRSSLSCIVDSNKQILKKKAGFWNINQFSDDIDYLTEVAEPDIVHICTPPQAHYSIIMHLIDKGVNLFVEKPFVLSMEELSSIQRNTKSIIHCNHNYTFKSCIVQLAKIVKEVDVRPIQIRTLYSIKTNSGLYDQEKDHIHWSYDIPSGPIINNISHPLSIISLFGGRFNTFTISQKINNGLDSWNVSIDGDFCHSNCSIFMNKKHFSKMVDFTFEDFSVRCDLHRDTLYFYNIRGSVLKDYLADSLKNIFYSVRDVFASIPRIYQSITRKMPDIDRSLSFFYKAIDSSKSSEINDTQITDTTKVIDKIINESEFIIKDN